MKFKIEDTDLLKWNASKRDGSNLWPNCGHDYSSLKAVTKPIKRPHSEKELSNLVFVNK